MKLIYCDYIADVLRTSLLATTETGASIVKGISSIKLDLHPIDGYMLSTKKTMTVTDRNGTKYLVTVEEMPEEMQPEEMPDAE